MEVNQDLTIPEEDVLEDTEDQTEAEIQEMIEVVEKESMIEVVKIATADVADGSSCKT